MWLKVILETKLVRKRRKMNFIEKTSEYVKNNERLKTSFISTYVMSLITNAFIYLNPVYAHDSCSLSTWPCYNSYTAARWFQSYLYNITDWTNATWLSGLLSTFFMFIAVYEIIVCIDIKKNINIWLVAALCVTDATAIATNLYGEQYVIFAALLFGCVSARMMISSNIRNRFIRSIIIILLACLCAATYGVYFAVIPTLVLMSLVIDIFRSKSSKQVVSNGLLCLAQMFAGLLLYFIILQLFLKKGSQGLQHYYGEDNLSKASTSLSGLKYVPEVYKNFVKYYLGMKPYRFVPTILSVLIVIATLFLMVIVFYTKRNSIANKKTNIIVMIIIAILFPIAVELEIIVTNNGVHYLMYFANVFVYIAAVKMIEVISDDVQTKCVLIKIVNSTLLTSICIFVCYGVVIANEAYTHVENMYERELSISTRILNDIEDNYTGNEDVVIVGKIDYDDTYFKSNYQNMTKLTDLGIADPKFANGFTYGGNMVAILRDIMGSNLRYIDCPDEGQLNACNELSEQEKKEILDMPLYPIKGSIKKMGKHIVVRFYTRFLSY